MAGLFGATATGAVAGRRLLERGPGPSTAVQDYTVSTFDDFQSAQPHGPYPQTPNHVVIIRENR